MTHTNEITQEDKAIEALWSEALKTLSAPTIQLDMKITNYRKNIMGQFFTILGRSMWMTVNSRLRIMSEDCASWIDPCPTLSRETVDAIHDQVFYL